jgi:glycosyltransferase involved in cell wall biosynthesis
MIRILHVVFSLDAGGMENGIVNVSAALPAAEYEVHVCCLARGGEFVRRFPAPERVHVLGKRDGFSLGTALALRGHIAKVRPDIIHTHNLGPLIYTVLTGTGVPIVHGEHAELTPAELAPRRRFLRRLLYRRVLRVHTVSSSLREQLIRLGFQADKIVTILNGVDTERFRPVPRAEARAATGLPVDTAIVGLVGRFGAFKRHMELIDAFEKVALKRRAAELLFVGGGGPMEAVVKARAAESPVAGRIHFSGFQIDPRPWIQSLNLLVLPSVNEGLSNALLEAMACGMPALAHTACGNAEVIQKGVTGYLRDLSSPDMMSVAMSACLADPELMEKTGRAARVDVEKRFSFPAMVAGYMRLYSDTISNQSR